VTIELKTPRSASRPSPTARIFKGGFVPNSSRRAFESDSRNHRQADGLLLSQEAVTPRKRGEGRRDVSVRFPSVARRRLALERRPEDVGLLAGHPQSSRDMAQQSRLFQKQRKPAECALDFEGRDSEGQMPGQKLKVLGRAKDNSRCA
jgi:hypothetical protein